MNGSIIALDKFINDFALKQPDGIVYFYSSIHFLVDQYAQKLEGDVHIVTSDNLATVYILGLNTKPWELPDMFTAYKDEFTYIENECLRIEGKGDPGHYVVSIYPNRK